MQELREPTLFWGQLLEETVLAESWLQNRVKWDWHLSEWGMGIQWGEGVGRREASFRGCRNLTVHILAGSSVMSVFLRRALEAVKMLIPYKVGEKRGSSGVHDMNKGGCSKRSFGSMTCLNQKRLLTCPRRCPATNWPILRSGSKQNKVKMNTQTWTVFSHSSKDSKKEKGWANFIRGEKVESFQKVDHS